MTLHWTYILKVDKWCNDDDNNTNINDDEEEAPNDNNYQEP